MRSKLSRVCWRLSGPDGPPEKETDQMLTPSQIKWAASHDWFIADNGDGTIKVRECFTINGVLFQEEPIRWTGSFRALREWAGY